eukprot:TRINITY_DN4118_c0_g1_i2.p1 TRINITY_DN4118_c0_g1~~TRINITY_DN4118_c0_g1_i2.p1  ORF type:complete len:330 (+),score=101.09 TRINITY_DN4118_c0_g1_i2:204-1193(+)
MAGHWSWSIELHRKLLSDPVRNKAFFNAFQKVIRNDVSVVDVGAGTGFLSFLASKLGAKQCTLFECDEEVSELSRRIAHRNGVERLKFAPHHTTDVPRVRPDQQADVVVSETLGTLALEENLLENMNDAKRFLRPGGLLIPGRLRQFVAPVVGETCQREVDTWSSVGFGLDLELLRRRSLSNAFQKAVPPGELLNGDESSAVEWDTIDFYATNESVRVSRPISWRLPRDTSIHGLCAWWLAELAPGVSLSTSPFAEPTHWQQAYIPLPKPFDGRHGDELCVVLRSDTRRELGVPQFDWSVWLQRGPDPPLVLDRLSSEQLRDDNIEDLD